MYFIITTKKIWFALKSVENIDKTLFYGAVSKTCATFSNVIQWQVQIELHVKPYDERIAS